MVQKRGNRPAPEITFRIPGPWADEGALVEALSQQFMVKGEYFFMKDGTPFAYEARPADEQFPSVFRIACRRPARPEELRQLDDYQMIACLVGRGGSMAAARRMMLVGAALIQAGGFGVFIDTGVTAHGGADWLELTENLREHLAVFYAYVNVVNLGTDYLSRGMHALGEPDGIIQRQGNEQSALMALEDFLRDRCRRPEVEIGEKGGCFEAENGDRFRVRKERDKSPYRDHPINNPFGRWRLEPVESAAGAMGGRGANVKG